MKNYCLRLFKDQRMVGGKNFQANDATAARFIAASLYDLCDDQCDAAELWQDACRIDWQPPRSATAVCASRQDQIVEKEITLANSAWAMERGRRLLTGVDRAEANCLMLVRQGYRK